jgi:hypothetical protein
MKIEKNKLTTELNSIRNEKQKQGQEYFKSFKQFKTEKNKLENIYNF